MNGLAGRSVVVTGADGFIGSHLVQRLVAEGTRVRALCLYNSQGSPGWLTELSGQERTDIDVVLGDIRDTEFVRSALAGVDIVFHLAALIAIPYSYTAPRSFLDTNVTGTLNVLEAVNSGEVGLMVNTSTSEVYGTPEHVPIRETHPLRAQSPYSASKIGADKMCQAYALSFDTPVVTLRPFNTFGPRQSARAVVPTILGQLLAGLTEVKLGSTRPKRDFTFVTDTCDGFVRTATAGLAPGETVQLGTGAAISIADLFEACTRATGTEAVIQTENERTRPTGSEVEVLLSDPTRAEKLLGWKPTVSLEEGLQTTAKWLAPRLDASTVHRYQR